MRLLWLYHGPYQYTPWQPSQWALLAGEERNLDHGVFKPEKSKSRKVWCGNLLMAKSRKNGKNEKIEKSKTFWFFDFLRVLPSAHPTSITPYFFGIVHTSVRSLWSFVWRAQSSLKPQKCLRRSVRCRVYPQDCQYALFGRYITYECMCIYIYIKEICSTCTGCWWLLYAWLLPSYQLGCPRQTYLFEAVC